MASDKNRELFLRMVEGQSMLASRFTEIRRLGPMGGVGHFSLLFTARDAESGRTVALKVFHPERRNDTYRLDCFNREEELLHQLVGQDDIVQAVSRLAHFTEAVPTTVGIDYSIEFSFFALELAESDLGAAIAANAYGPERNLEVFRAACRGLQRLHGRGLIQRDIKPPNYLIMSDGSLRLSDLGTSRSIVGNEPQLRPSYAGFWPGDLRYAAPEMLAGLFDSSPELAIGADIYALGAILFELFTGVALSGLVFDGHFAIDLVSTMAVVPESHRRQVYEDFLHELSAGHPLPDIQDISPDIPECLRSRVNELYKAMANLDFRMRLTDYRSIFRRIQACLLVFRNEVRYMAWMEEKKRRRSIRAERIRNR